MGKAALLIDDDVKANLDREAALVGDSASSVAETAIAVFLQNQEMKREAIAEAVKEADKGVFISREAMDRWVRSWGTENELQPPKPDIFRNR